MICTLESASLWTRSILRRESCDQKSFQRIQEADMVVSTSVGRPTQLALLESMAAGTPWVSFDVGSARENAGGVVAGDLSEMANAITELLRDPDRRKSLGEAGRARSSGET